MKAQVMMQANLRSCTRHKQGTQAQTPTIATSALRRGRICAQDPGRKDGLETSRARIGADGSALGGTQSIVLARRSVGR